MTSVAYFFGGPKDGDKAAIEAPSSELKFRSLNPPVLGKELRVGELGDEILYRRRGPVREGVAYYDFVAEAPV